jgi:hypothetical protein
MKDCRWLKPVLVGQFEFVEWTPDKTEDSGEAERCFRRKAERHSGMNPNTFGASRRWHFDCARSVRLRQGKLIYTGRDAAGHKQYISKAGFEKQGDAADAMRAHEGTTTRRGKTCRTCFRRTSSTVAR